MLRCTWARDSRSHGQDPDRLVRVRFVVRTDSSRSRDEVGACEIEARNLPQEIGLASYVDAKEDFEVWKLWPPRNRDHHIFPNVVTKAV